MYHRQYEGTESHLYMNIPRHITLINKQSAVPQLLSLTVKASDISMEHKTHAFHEILTDHYPKMPCI